MTSETNKPTAEQWSALVDGELDATATADCCAHWRDDESARSAWHRHQLIGDVLRSDDLARAPGHDEAFLAALRVRLSREAVVLAPAAAPGELAARPRNSAIGAGRRWSWLASSAVAAGFVAVAGLLLVMRPPDRNVELQASARLGPAGTGGVAMAGSAVPVASLEAPGSTGVLLRDARLDQYLAAHNQFAGSSALGVPSVYLRSATADASKR